MWFQKFTLVSFLISYAALSHGNELAGNSSQHNQESELSPIMLEDSPSSASPISAASSPLKTYQQALNYLLGRNGVSKSAEKAASLFKTLAEQNWSSAQHMLGNMYMTGKGVEKNDLLAYKWLSLASRNNLQLAEAIHTKRKQLYNKLQENLSHQSLSKVDMWIAEWQPSASIAQVN